MVESQPSTLLVASSILVSRSKFHSRSNALLSLSRVSVISASV